MGPMERHGAGNYRIVIEGELEDRWAAYFEGFSISVDDGQTLLSGHIDDQSRLHGVLARIRDLGVVLLSVHRVVGDSNG